MASFSSFVKDTRYQDTPTPVISREMIDVQKDRSFIDSLVTAIGNTNKTEATKEISKILTDRFGYNIKVFSNTQCDFFCFPLQIGSISTLVMDDRKWHFEMYGEDVEAEDDLENIRSLDSYSDQEAAFSNVLIMYKKSLKDNRLNNLEIDTKNAKIKGLPSDYTSYISMDLRTGGELHLSAIEIVAILLHEVGHTFTYIENAYRNIRSNTILLETLRNEVEVKGKSFNKSIKLAYKNIYGEEPKTDNPKVILGSLLENYQYEVARVDNVYSQTDSEAIADQFVSRLGLSKELVSGLHKLYDSNDIYTKSNWFLIQPVIDVFVYSRFLQLLTLGGFVYLSPMLIFGFFAVIVSGILRHHDGESTISTYDDIVRRFKRVKSDTIRILRERGGELDPKYKANLLRMIDKIEKTMNEYNKTNTYFVEEVIRLFSSNARRMFDVRKSQQLIEDMLENDIYVGVEKLKLRYK